MTSITCKAAHSRRRRRKKSSQYSSDVVQGLEVYEDVDLDAKLQKYVSELEISFYLKETKQAILRAYSGSSPKISTIVAYGIGSFSKSSTARYHLALALLLKDWLQCNRMLVFDPVFSETEKDFLVSIGCVLITENEGCRRQVDLNEPGKTLFFMPHLDKSLFNNLLWANWDQSRLEKLALLGNSFKEIMYYLPSRIFSTEYSYIHNSVQLGLVNENPVNNVFKFNDVFNDISFHNFYFSNVNKEKFRAIYSSVEPVYTEDADAVFV